MTSKEIIAALEGGAQANRDDQFREGNLICLPSRGEAIMTGDLHGNERNFEKLVRFGDLGRHSGRHLILHELFHDAEVKGSADQCHSYNLVAQAAKLKMAYPNQVHILAGNHAMAQLVRGEVLKNGQPMVRSLTTGIEATFGENSPHVVQALDQYILSLPLAARSENRIWMSHSLPSERHLGGFDGSIFTRQLTIQDFELNNSLHALLWDRRHSEACLAELGRMWGVDLFVIGHQPQSQGYGRVHRELMILASEHSHGCFLPFDLGEKYDPDQIFHLIKTLASIS